MMNYFQKKKLAFMSIVNKVKGFVRTVTGVLPLTLTNCVDEESIIDYTLYGQSVQNGTPTPETPVEVESVGEYDETTGKYKIPIKVSGKNLFDKSDYSYTVGYYNDNGEYAPSSNGKTAYTNNYSQVEPNTTYHITELHGYSGITLAVYFYDKDKQWLSRYKYVIPDVTAQRYKGQTFITPNECKYVRFQIFLGTDKFNIPFNADTFQFELGDVSTTYEPYHEPITTNIYLDEPLRKVGDYADYIDFENGKVIRNVKETRLNNTTFIYTWIGKKGVTFYEVLDNNYNRIKGLCNRNKIWTANGVETYTMWLGVNSKTVYWMGILDYLGFTTLKEMNEWLTNNPTYVFYGTDIPTETPITLPNLPTFKGTSIISADTTVQPSNAEIEYYSNVKE